MENILLNLVNIVFLILSLVMLVGLFAIHFLETVETRVLNRNVRPVENRPRQYRNFGRVAYRPRRRPLNVTVVDPLYPKDPADL